MRIAIFGCGAMGTVLGAFLNKNGLEVTLIDSYADHVKALNEKGAHIIGCADFTVPVKAITPEQMEGIYDIVFLFTKQTANAEALPHLKQFLKDDSVVCTLQNGVPEYSVSDYIGGDRTVGGTVLWGATFISPGVSEVTQDVTSGDNLFDIGEIDGKITDRIQKVAAVLEHMGPACIVENLMGARWSKLILNSCMSGMSAVTGSVFGDVLDNPKASTCLSYIANDIVSVCEAAKIKLEDVMGMDMRDFGKVDTKENFEYSQKCFRKFYADKRTAKASMLQDLEKGKKTEVDMINGFVVEQGKKYEIPTPYNDIAVKIIKGIENNELPLSMDNLKFFDLPELK
ncbi:MAG: 2-dehydropantoate 2-reductase [Sedimentibacter sp.]|jgi:2-dehydropantoate 2-reductase|nr:2-dehydropantoate 2-reductase [Sedimentibacter sp.]